MNDGSFRWVAERADLLWALSELGWVREDAGAHHDHWTQPEGEGSPYNALCEEVSAPEATGPPSPCGTPTMISMSSCTGQTWEWECGRWTR